MKQPELKLGRPCIVDYGSLVSTKAKYIQAYDDGHHVLIDSGIIFTHNVKPDPEGPPMNGDEVEFKHYSGKWSPETGRYIGKKSDGTHLIESADGVPFMSTEVRHPQPSKREKLIDLIEEKGKYSLDVVFYEEFADEILKITEDE